MSVNANVVPEPASRGGSTGELCWNASTRWITATVQASPPRAPAADDGRSERTRLSSPRLRSFARPQSVAVRPRPSRPVPVPPPGARRWRSSNPTSRSPASSPRAASGCAVPRPVVGRPIELARDRGGHRGGAQRHRRHQPRGRARHRQEPAAPRGRRHRGGPRLRHRVGLGRRGDPRPVPARARPLLGRRRCATAPATASSPPSTAPATCSRGLGRPGPRGPQRRGPAAPRHRPGDHGAPDGGAGTAGGAAARRPPVGRPGQPAPPALRHPHAARRCRCSSRSAIRPEESAHAPELVTLLADMDRMGIVKRHPRRPVPPGRHGRAPPPGARRAGRAGDGGRDPGAGGGRPVRHRGARARPTATPGCSRWSTARGRSRRRPAASCRRASGRSSSDGRRTCTRTTRRTSSPTRRSSAGRSGRRDVCAIRTQLGQTDCTPAAVAELLDAGGRRGPARRRVGALRAPTSRSATSRSTSSRPAG